MLMLLQINCVYIQSTVPVNHRRPDAHHQYQLGLSDIASTKEEQGLKFLLEVRAEQSPTSVSQHSHGSAVEDGLSVLRSKISRMVEESNK